MTENDLRQLEAYGAQFAGDDTGKFNVGDVVEIIDTTDDGYGLRGTIRGIDGAGDSDMYDVMFAGGRLSWYNETQFTFRHSSAQFAGDDTERLPDAGDLIVNQAELIKRLEARVETLEAALMPFAECGLFFRLSARDKDERSLRSYSGTYMTEMINPLDALKVVNFRRALQAMKDEFS